MLESTRLLVLKSRHEIISDEHYYYYYSTSIELFGSCSVGIYCILLMLYNVFEQGGDLGHINPNIA